MTILTFYEKVLNSMNHKVLDDDLISFVDPEGKVKPTTVDGRRLVMPTTKRLREGFDDELQPFHPLAESIARKGTSPVLRVMQRTIKPLVAHYTVEVARRLLEVAADKTLHADLPPTCSEYLKKVTQADKKMISVFDSLVEAAMKKNEFIVVYLKNGGKHQGKVVNRLCVIHFPFIEALEAGDDTVFGVKLRKKDRETIAALMHYVMPFGSDPEHYSAGSDSRMAPYFDALMRAYYNVATQLNKMVKRYAKHIDIPLSEIDLSFMSKLKDMKEYHDQIPSLRGNVGAASEEESEVVAEVVEKPTVKPVVAAQTETTRPKTPAPGAVSMKDLMAAMQPQYAPPPPMYSNQPVQGYSQPQQHVPQWLQPNQPQAPVNQNPFNQILGSTQPQSHPTNHGYHNTMAPSYGGQNNYSML